MNYLYDCRKCGAPVYGTVWRGFHHVCITTPSIIIHPIPQASQSIPQASQSIPEPTESSSLADTITPDEATRLCHLIGAEICNHRVSCEYCKLANKLQLPIQPCKDGIALQEAFKKWEQYTLIEVDRT